MAMNSLLAAVLLLVASAGALSNEFTVAVDPGKEECFYTSLTKDLYLEIDYQVIDGDQGELDVDFYLASPTGRRIIAESRKSDSSHRIKATEEGDYKVCFDNSFSMFNTKTVFFELATATEESDENGGDGGDSWEDDGGKAFYDGLRLDEVYDIQVQDIKDSVAKVRGQLNRAQQFQDQLRAFEARDRHVAESNYTLVNFWSLCHMVAMVATGLIQVVMVRSLFDEKSVVRRIWKQVH